MPTISGIRNRGYTTEIIEALMNRCGISKANSIIENSLLSEVARDYLNPKALRTMAIINPVELILDNLDESFEVDISNHPKDSTKGYRTILLSNKLFIGYQKKIAFQKTVSFIIDYLMKMAHLMNTT